MKTNTTIYTICKEVKTYYPGEGIHTTTCAPWVFATKEAAMDHIMNFEAEHLGRLKEEYHNGHLDTYVFERNEVSSVKFSLWESNIWE